MMSIIFSFFSILLVSVGIMLVIIFNTTPSNVFNLNVASFYIFGALLLVSILNLIRALLKEEKFSFVFLRRSVLFSIAIMGLVLFSASNLLNVLSGISFILFVFLLELFFISKTKVKHES